MTIYYINSIIILVIQIVILKVVYLMTNDCLFIIKINWCNIQYVFVLKQSFPT